MTVEQFAILVSVGLESFNVGFQSFELVSEVTPLVFKLCTAGFTLFNLFDDGLELVVDLGSLALFFFELPTLVAQIIDLGDEVAPLVHILVTEVTQLLEHCFDLTRVSLAPTGPTGDVVILLE